jgi:UDP-N-acetylmuramyl pentapeptide phosphotransferase/UDP-N-acetylglucosamine-1-phosphate transferase
VKRFLLAGVAAAAAPAIVKAIAGSQFSKDLERTNFRGATVSLAGGPALAATATVTAAAGAADARTAAAVLTAGLGSGAVGLYDDIVGARPEQKGYKGFAGHLRGLREGRVTGGAAKIAGVGASALLASAMLPSKRRGFGRAVEVVLGAGVIAGSANLLNLLDLRPGRALKSSLLVAGPLSGGKQGAITAGPMGAAGALLPQDLGEEIMLGDTGANAMGAVLGVRVAAGTGRFGRAVVLAGIAALTLASEKVSFTKVIEKTPGLREIDGWGRQP